MSGNKKAYYEMVLESECPKTEIQCKGCKKKFLTTTILKHLGHKKSCKDSYQNEEFNLMQERAKLRKWANIKSWLDKNDQSRNNTKRYEKHKEKKQQMQNTSDDEELSDYEKIRLTNIEENKLLLQEFKSKNKMYPLPKNYQ